MSSTMRGGCARSAGSTTRNANIEASRISTAPASTLATVEASLAGACSPPGPARSTATNASAQAPSSSTAFLTLERSPGRRARSAMAMASATAMAQPICVRRMSLTSIAGRSGSEPRLDALAEHLERLDAREELIVGGDHVPRGEIRGRAVDHVVHRALVLRPLLAVAPVLVGDLEALVGSLLARLEAAQLFRGRDGEPELHHEGARARELLLEVVDLVVGAHPVELGGEALDPLDQHAPVPRAVEDREAPVPGNLAPEAPQVGLRALLVRGRCHRDHAVEARVDRLGDAPDGAALAGGVHALEHHDDRALAHLLRAREPVQAPLQPDELLRVDAMIELALVVERG